MNAPVHFQTPSASPLAPVLVLDSGLGGLTVARALRRRLPHEKLLYFGDTARVPYGSKSPRTITAYVSQIVAYLRPHEPKHVVVACNSATAVALPALRERFPGLSISGVIDPGARAAARAAGEKLSPTIAVIATEATVRSKAYEHAIARRRAKARIVLRSAPLLVPIIEEGRREDDPLVTLCLEQYLLPIRKHRPDVLVLGCTHYPILRRAIERVMGAGCRVIDSAEAAAEDVEAKLAAAGLLRPAMADVLDPVPPIRLYASDESPRVARLAARFLGEPVESARVVSPETLYEQDLPPAATLVLPARAPAAGVEPLLSA